MPQTVTLGIFGAGKASDEIAVRAQLPALGRRADCVRVVAQRAHLVRVSVRVRIRVRVRVRGRGRVKCGGPAGAPG